MDNSFIAAVGVATETTGVGSTMPQLNITSYADFVANDLYLGGTASGNQIINSSGEAVNLMFDGGSYWLCLMNLVLNMVMSLKHIKTK